MGRVQRYKKYKKIDPFHKQSLIHPEELTGFHKLVDKGLRKKPKRTRKDTDYDRCPDTDGNNQFRKTSLISNCSRKRERSTKDGAQGTSNVEKIKLRPGESRKQYFRRLDSEVGKAMQKAMMDTRAIRDKRKQHLKQRDTKKKEARRNREVDKPMKKPSQDVPRFGEVAEAPPDLTLPRKASKQRGTPGLNLAQSLNNSDGKESITLSKKKRKLMTEDQRQAFDTEREDVIKKYRALKARAEFRLKASAS